MNGKEENFLREEQRIRKFLGEKACAQSPSHVCLFAIPWTVAHQFPLSMQQYWSRLPFPPPGGLPNPGIEPMSPATSASVGRFFTYRATREGHPQCPWPFLISE